MNLVKHERDINHQLNKELRLLCIENSSLKAKNNTLSEKIKELDTTIRDLELNLDFDEDVEKNQRSLLPGRKLHLPLGERQIRITNMTLFLI